MTAHAQYMLSLPGEGCLAGSLALLPEEDPVCFLPVATNRSSWKNRTFTLSACLLGHYFWSFFNLFVSFILVIHYYNMSTAVVIFLPTVVQKVEILYVRLL